MPTEIEDDSPITGSRKTGILGKLFGSCASDPRGSVHRAWGISLLFVVVYFALAVVESECWLQATPNIFCLIFHQQCRNFVIAILYSNRMACYLFLNQPLWHSDQFEHKWWISCSDSGICLDGHSTFGIGCFGNLCTETIPHKFFRWLSIGCFGSTGQPESDLVCYLFIICPRIR